MVDADYFYFYTGVSFCPSATNTYTSDLDLIHYSHAFSSSLAHSLSQKNHPSNMETTGHPVTSTLLQSESSPQVPRTSEPTIALREGRERVMSKPMYMCSWPLRGERFISVLGREAVRRGYKSLVEWLTRGHREGCEGHNINSTETSNTRSTDAGKDKCYDKIKNQLPLHNSE